MYLMSLFSNPLGWDNLTINNKRVEDYVAQAEHDFPDHKKIVGWQSGLLDLSAEPLSELVEVINTKLQEIARIYDFKDEYAPKLTTSWINVNKPNGRMLENNVCHLHPGRFFSFVYYVKAEPNCGNLDLLSPMRDVLGYAIPNQVYNSFTPCNSLKWTVTPETGKLVMFPGWIQHQASQNNSNSDRISIAFNADIQNLQKLQYPG
jgi:uncharacterized protein (TIGR02466 family)